MNNQGIGSWIGRRARMTPWKTALINDGSVCSYEKLNKKVTQLAHGLRSIGLKKGDRIAYLNENHFSYLEVFFAAGLLGAIFVPLNIKLPPSYIDYILDKTGCKVLIYGPEAADYVDYLKSSGALHTYICLTDNCKDDPTINSVINKQPDSPVDENVSVNETALISFTSGTTGKPKGVMLSHNNLMWNVFNLMSCTDFLAEDKILVNAPLNRMGALGVAILPGIYKGATLIITAEKKIEKIAAIIDEQKISVLFNGPDFFQELDEYSNHKKTDLSSIRFCIVGGDVVSPALIQRWLGKGVQFQQGYGLTEASPVALLLDKEEIMVKNGSAGRPMFFTEVRVVSQDMKDVEPDQYGEIILRGPNITKGYWKDESLTGKRITGDGWLHSGDAARIDNDNHIYILGRVQDGIRLDKRIVYPSEIENIIGQHPEIEECAVIGSPRQNGDRLVAFVVRKKNADISAADLIKSWSGKLHARLIPDTVRFVDSLPKNANGKIIRHKLNDLISQNEVFV